MSRRIVLTGATGHTGNAVAHALATRDDARLAALVAPSVAATPTRPLPEGIPAVATLEEALVGADDLVVVDLTHAEPATRHVELAAAQGVPAVVGATGIEHGELDRLGDAAREAGLPLLVVPNFSIGAAVLLRAALGAVAAFPDVEVIEAHRAGKRDAPSGTAARAARELARVRAEGGGSPAATAAGPARGELVDGVPVHALRLPGASAHQEIVFGGDGELLSFRHDVIDRGVYAAGVALAAARIDGLGPGLHVGLEQVL